MNELLRSLKNETNYTLTENGASTHKSTLSKVLDMFALGGSMRKRSEDDIITLFKDAYEENHTLALRCLFYHRDCRCGSGQRRFFRICIKWLANNYPDEMANLIPLVATYGRYDDLFELFDTHCEEAMLAYIKYVIDKNEDHLIYKWMPSINASSPLTKKRGRFFAEAFSMSERQYRKMLSEGRKACNLVETLMSQNHWDNIDFSCLPSRAGLLYKNAFARREETKARYAEFMANKDTKVNASVLTPVDIASQIYDNRHVDTIKRNAWQKYWDALPDYYHGHEEPGIAVVDVSGSMYGQPLEAAVSMGAYIAERGQGPFKNHFITFSAHPQLVEFTGSDIFDKFWRARFAAWGNNTNIEAVFDLLLQTGLKNHVPNSEMPKTIYIFSDMEFDHCVISNSMPNRYGLNLNNTQIDTVLEVQAQKWKFYGYEVPRIIFWNLDARQNNIPAIGPGFSYISGFSMNMIEAVLSGKDGYDLMLQKLDSIRYNIIKSLYEN